MSDTDEQFEGPTLADLVGDELLAEEVGEVLVNRGYYVEVTDLADSFTMYEGDPRLPHQWAMFAFVMSKKTRHIYVHYVKTTGRPTNTTCVAEILPRPTDLIDLFEYFDLFRHDRPGVLENFFGSDDHRLGRKIMI